MTICAANLRFARRIGVGFVSCDRDCYGAAVTDFMLAVHAGWAARRAMKRLWAQQARLTAAGGSTACGARPEERHTLAQVFHPSCRPALGALLIGFMCASFVWSMLGAIFWAQPAGARWPGPTAFELAWRLNAQAQAVVLFFSWRILLAINRVGNIWPSLSRRETAISWAAAAHAVGFGVATLLPTSCELHEYVVFGGSNISSPLFTAWVAFLVLVRRYGLLRPAAAGRSTTAWRVHPLGLIALSGVWFWMGNSAVLLGNRVGVPVWIRGALSRLSGIALRDSHWEEMATFHFGGLLGNAMLFIGYEWCALAELGEARALEQAGATALLKPALGHAPAGNPELASDSASDASADTVISAPAGAVRAASPPSASDGDEAWLASLLSAASRAAAADAEPCTLAQHKRRARKCE